MNHNNKKGAKSNLKFRPFSLEKIVDIFRINDLRDFQIALLKCCSLIFSIILVAYIAFKIISN